MKTVRRERHVFSTEANRYTWALSAQMGIVQSPRRFESEVQKNSRNMCLIMISVWFLSFLTSFPP